MALVMSETWNSSRQSRRVPLSTGLITAATGSALSALALADLRNLAIAACTSAMNSWKCTRRFSAIATCEKNRSIKSVLPRPTSPTR